MPHESNVECILTLAPESSVKRTLYQMVHHAPVLSTEDVRVISIRRLELRTLRVSGPAVRDRRVARPSAPANFVASATSNRVAPDSNSWGFVPTAGPHAA